LSPWRLVSGTILALGGVWLFILGFLYYSVLPWILAAYFLYTGATSANYNPRSRRVAKLTYDGIVETGIERINTGRFHVNRDDFISTVSKIRDIISTQDFVPDFGIDSIYLHYANEKEANEASSRITALGIQCMVVQEKTGWKVKVEINGSGNEKSGGS